MASAARPWVVIGNPGHRRVTLFESALTKQGSCLADVIAWEALAAPGGAARAIEAIAPDAIVRIDSFGESDEVERALLRRGEAAARAEGAPAISAAQLARIPVEVGRIIHPRQLHLGFVAVLGELEGALAARPDLAVPQTPAAIRPLFDKRATSAAWTALGIPVPDELPGGPVRDPDDLRARMEAQGWTSVFVKLTSGSSASCVAVFVHRPRDEHVVTTVEDTGTARYNTRRLQRTSDRRRIDRTLRFILGEGAIVERTIPKAMIPGEAGEADARYFDLRVLTIDGVAAFVVVRTSPHPITNLHLGGLRGDVDALRARVDPAAWEAAMASCVAVQRASGAFHVGVDLMFEVGLRAHRVIEGNAFGDLLPNLSRDGLDVYGWQIARYLRSG
ncbi:MAG: STM4014 family protein [Proteobacteria bacterium]|nr:STM4014 family protein [Pseudomonadota bacterium]